MIMRAKVMNLSKIYLMQISFLQIHDIRSTIHNWSSTSVKTSKRFSNKSVRNTPLVATLTVIRKMSFILL